MRHIVIPLSHTKPPITANNRLHWAQRARIVKDLRTEAFLRARSQRLPSADKITFRLHYRPRDNRRRDVGNLMPTHKALLDGIVDAGIVEDDTPRYVDELMPRIHPPSKGEPPGLWLEIGYYH